MTPPNIDTLLADLLQAWRDKPFAWGRADCCQFAIAAQNHLYGLQLAFGPYTTERGAARLLATLGGLDVALSSAGLHHLRHPRLAQRGDLVVWQNKGAKTASSQGLAVCDGMFAQAVGKSGLQAIEQGRWVQAWSRNLTGPAHA